MTIYDDDVFRMACAQFQVISDYLSIDKNHRDRLMYPKRAIAVTLPVHISRAASLDAWPDQGRDALRPVIVDG